MDTFDAIYQRRSIKQYDPQHKLSPEEETKLFEAAIQAPTSSQRQYTIYLTALFIPHRCPKCFESVRVMQPQHKGGAFGGPITQSRHSPNGFDRQQPAKSGHSAVVQLTGAGQ
jgi:hypothetical protein